MPNRLLKQSICTSESIDELDWFEEVMYYRLIVTADDYGCMDARPKILKAALFPLKEVKLSQIEKGIRRLQEAGLITTYTVEGMPYLCFPKWGDHQRLRTTKHRYPTMDQADSDSLQQPAVSCGKLRQDAADCGESRQIAASCGLTRTRKEYESEYESEYEVESESENNCSELQESATEQPDLADVPAIPLNDGSEWRPTEREAGEWAELYPAVDIKTEFGRMRQWCLDNPKRKKTAKGVRRFARGWLDRQQNRGWRGSGNTQRGQPADPMAWMKEMEGW